MSAIQELIYKAYESQEKEFRPHLGVSQIGEKCDRKMWLGFRHALQPKHSGRILKLFQFGHDYESTVIKELKAIGCRIISQQASVDFGCHIRGSCDGIITNVPGYEGQTLLLEIKTLSEKSFKDLVKKELQESKPMYWAQVHVYMLGLKLERCLFYAVNKNTSEIYTEIVDVDKEYAQKLIDKAKKIALSEYLPEPMSADPSWFECKFCDFYKFCFETKITDSVNCRTCAHITPTQDSQWLCARHDNEPVPVSWQRSGCESHVLHPDLVPYPRQPSENPHEAVYVINGVPVRNGEPCGYVFGSKEILADPELCANPNDDVLWLRDELGAKIVEKTLLDPLTS